MGLNRYKVHVSRFHKIVVNARTTEGARRGAWREIAGGFRYGYDNYTDFKKRVRVERIS